MYTERAAAPCTEARGRTTTRRQYLPTTTQREEGKAGGGGRGRQRDREGGSAGRAAGTRDERRRAKNLQGGIPDRGRHVALICPRRERGRVCGENRRPAAGSRAPGDKRRVRKRVRGTAVARNRLSWSPSLDRPKPASWISLGGLSPRRRVSLRRFAPRTSCARGHRHESPATNLVRRLNFQILGAMDDPSFRVLDDSTTRRHCLVASRSDECIECARGDDNGVTAVSAEGCPAAGHPMLKGMPSSFPFFIK